RVGVVADAALRGPAADVVLHAPAGVDVDRAVVPAHREVHGELSLDLAKDLARVVRKTHHVGRGVKTTLGGLVSGTSRFDRHARDSTIYLRHPGSAMSGRVVNCTI